MTEQEILTVFIGIAKDIYESAYDEKTGNEAVVTATLPNDNRIKITITEEGAKND